MGSGRCGVPGADARSRKKKLEQWERERLRRLDPAEGYQWPAVDEAYEWPAPAHGDVAKVENG